MKLATHGLVLATIVGASCGRYNIGTVDAESADDVATDAVLDPSLVVWYRMEDDPTDGAIVDTAGDDHPAVCSPGLSCGTTVGGRSGQALGLTAPQHYQLFSQPSLVMLGGFTVAMWIYVDSAPAPNLSSYWFTKRYSSSLNTWGVRLNPAMHLQFETTAGTLSDMLEHGLALPLATWLHITITWDTATKRAYINGARVAETATAVTFDMSELLLGADNDNASIYGWAHGRIDEVRLYSRALGDAEVNQLFTLP